MGVVCAWALARLMAALRAAKVWRNKRFFMKAPVMSNPNKVACKDDADSDFRELDVKGDFQAIFSARNRVPFFARRHSTGPECPCRRTRVPRGRSRWR